jgi:hypothetical protein
MRNKWKMENGKWKNPNLAGAQSSTSCCKIGMKSEKWEVEKWKTPILHEPILS